MAFAANHPAVADAFGGLTVIGIAASTACAAICVDASKLAVSLLP
jgi:hypothetical protein